MNEKYVPAEVETAAQAHWNALDAYRVTEDARDSQGQLKPKFYACSMLPYPRASCTWATCATTPSTTC
jgi:leucyl-tRNA synthetase